MVRSIYKYWLLVSKTAWGICTTSHKQWKVQKVEICSATTFVEKIPYVQRIYRTLLSTTCGKIHQISYVIFEVISHFLRHNSSVFLSWNITYFLQKQPIKVQTFSLSTARVKGHQIPRVIFQTKNRFFFKVWIFF